MIKLLLVEDDASLGYMVKSSLEDLIGGYEVIIANNGKEGLDAWKEHRPDIIVADIEMPVMDGREMVAKIREIDGDTPVLFASARYFASRSLDVFVTKLRKHFSDDPFVEIRTVRRVGLALEENLIDANLI